jgi:hypothetical protein
MAVKEPAKKKEIFVGDLVYLKDSRDDGPVGVVLEEIITQQGAEEYKCHMIGKNGKTILMVFSKNDLRVMSRTEKEEEI